MLLPVVPGPSRVTRQCVCVFLSLDICACILFVFAAHAWNVYWCILLFVLKCSSLYSGQSVCDLNIYCMFVERQVLDCQFGMFV